VQDAWLRPMVLALVLAAPAWPSPAPAVDYIWEQVFAKRLRQAEAGDADAQYAVGEAYLKGRGPAVDPQEALKWFRRAARQGHPKALYRLGYMHLRGIGVRRDPARAFQLIRQAAEAGYSPAQYQLGRMYAAGLGTGRDFDAALEWLEKAASQDYLPAREEIARVRKLREEAARQAAAPKPRKPPAARQARAEPRRAKKPKAPGSAQAKRERRLDIKTALMSAGWIEDRWPSDHLPSARTTCRDEGARLVCRSRERERVTGGVEMTYFVETVISDFAPDGRFRARYRANITYAMPEDPDDPEANVVVPSTGWQKTIHELDCRMSPDGARIECLKDGRARVEFRRVGGP